MKKVKLEYERIFNIRLKLLQLYNRIFQMSKGKSVLLRDIEQALKSI